MARSVARGRVIIMSPSSSDSPPVLLVPYDDTWPARFREEEKAIRRVLAGHLAGPIEHVGSTAVPGLAAKPIIDIMVGVTSLAESRSIIPLLAEIGYVHYPYRPDVMHWFCKPSAAFRTHHLHAIPVGSALWRDRLAFRDYLRAHPETRLEYAALKAELAERHHLDREAYTEAKTPFIARVLNAAR